MFWLGLAIGLVVGFVAALFMARYALDTFREG